MDSPFTIEFIYMNMGIDKWPNDEDYKNFNRYITKYVKGRNRRGKILIEETQVQSPSEIFSRIESQSDATLGQVVKMTQTRGKDIDPRDPPVTHDSPEPPVAPIPPITVKSWKNSHPNKKTPSAIGTPLPTSNAPFSSRRTSHKNVPIVTPKIPIDQTKFKLKIATTLHQLKSLPVNLSTPEEYAQKAYYVSLLTRLHRQLIRPTLTIESIELAASHDKEAALKFSKRINLLEAKNSLSLTYLEKDELEVARNRLNDLTTYAQKGGWNEGDDEAKYVCYIKNRFFTLYNQRLAETVKNHFKTPVVFLFGEFCNVDGNYKSKTGDSYLKYKTAEGKSLVEWDTHPDSGKDVPLRTTIPVDDIDYTDVMAIDNNLQTLGVHSFFLQYYGNSRRFREDDHMNIVKKYFVSASTYPPEKLLIGNDKGTQSVLIDNSPRNMSANTYFGCIQVSFIKPSNKSQIMVLNLHNRFHKALDLKKSLSECMKKYPLKENILLLGDFNITEGRINVKEGNALPLSSFEADLKLLLPNVQQDESIDALYDKYSIVCGTQRKRTHIRLYHALSNYTLKINMEVDCVLNIKTSSHQAVKFTLTEK